MAPITLAQAIERVVNIEEAGPPFAGLSDAITKLSEARHRLDGLEESRALLDTRAKAYERAGELLRHASPLLAAVPEKLLELARFLAPAWADLETGADPLGPDSTPEELAASEAAAIATADELEDRLNRALADNAALAGTIERLERDNRTLTNRNSELASLAAQRAARITDLERALTPGN